jgi:RNA polymerase sigma-70 factor (ECF subfamily)
VEVTDQHRRARFEALAAEVYEPLQRYVRRRTTAHAVDDVVADTLLVCWRRLDDVPDDTAVPWVFGVARKCLANVRRGTQRQEALGHRLAAQPAPAGVTTEPDLDLQAAVAELPELDREIVLLWAWEGLEPREIAVVVGTTANAVSIRLFRVKQRLAARLATDVTPAGRKDATGTGHVTGEATPHPGATPDRGEEQR